MSIPAQAILAEAERRGWLQAQTLAMLTLAIDEGWTSIPAGFIEQLAQLAHPTVDPWYNLAQLRRVAPDDWQAFKTRLYFHIRTAGELLEGKTMTKDQVAQLIVAEAKARKHTRDECLAEMSALYQESGWDETIWDDTHVTYGVAQQDGLLVIDSVVAG